jgi:hypothetical protein
VAWVAEVACITLQKRDFRSMAARTVTAVAKSLAGAVHNSQQMALPLSSLDDGARAAIPRLL